MGKEVHGVREYSNAVVCVGLSVVVRVAVVETVALE